MESERHYPLVLVTWRDCTTFRGWHSVEESLKFEPDAVETTGFILREDGDFLCVSPSLSGTGDTVTTLDPMMIPRSWVTKVEKLGLAAGCTCEKEEEEEKLASWQSGAGQRPAPDPVPALKEACDAYLEVKQGDDHLGRQLTLDEHLRRGGTYATWPARMMTHFVGDSCNPPHEEMKEKE